MAEATSLTIELRPGSDPIDGRLIGPDGEVSPFRGWIELVAALNRWVETNKEEATR